jgi:KUP system potassium uptake protein
MAQALNQNAAEAVEVARQNLVLGALGVVYGDIGTSPLYALKQSVDAAGGVSPAAVLGVLSLITWALTIVVTVKYVLVVMRADNRGEGGILALTALVLRVTSADTRAHAWIMVAGLIGASLFYGDSVITPAISVLSAVEGLKVAEPVLHEYVIPITLVLIVGLFMVQRHGTGRVGSLFGPVMVLWFGTLAVLGAQATLDDLAVFRAINPLYAVNFLADDPGRGFVLLGAVVLAVTGGEALYADMGHFGREPIRKAWLRLVFPALLLNYYGQGALLLRYPEAIDNPFYRLAPDWALYPLVVLASLATIIASQAVISGAFSITHQAVQLGYLPRLKIRHTSAEEAGQIYVSKINIFLFIAVVALVLGFRSSENLAAAYGIAVTGAMAIDSALALVYMVGIRQWPPAGAAMLFGLFLTVDLAFFGANLLKFIEGGWFPLLVATVIFALMSTWMRGRAKLAAQRARDAMPLQMFLDSLRPDHPIRVPGTAVFLTGNVDVLPTHLLHNLKHNKVLHERVVLLCVRTGDVPRVPEEERLEISHLSKGFHTLVLHYGFMDEPSIPRALAQCRREQFRFNLLETSFFLGREKLVPVARQSRLSRWRTQLFIFRQNEMLNATEFFRLPTNRVIEVGGQFEI